LCGAAGGAPPPPAYVDEKELAGYCEEVSVEGAEA
jgi:hypothetical protein